MENKQNRWLIVVGGILINLMLGVTYTWSVFGSALQSQYNWLATDQTLAFSIMLFFFAITMPIAGRLQDRYGPRIALIGGILLSAGFILSGYALQNNIFMYITYGVLAGSGVGFAYNSPIASANKWFPDKRGLVVGLMVFGFGFGSVILAPMAEIMIKGIPKQPTGLITPLVAQLFNFPYLKEIAGIGLSNTFMTLGVLFLIFITIGALLLKNPPKGWKPAGCDTSTSAKKNKQSAKDYTVTEMIKMKEFWMLWIMFTFSAAAGLMVIGFLKNFATLVFQTNHGFSIESAGLEGAIAVSVLAIFNGVGRILAGWASDHIGRSKSMFIFSGLQAVLVITLIYSTAYSPLMVYLVMALIGMCFGSNFSLFPSATADFFGTKNCGVNYGVMFTAYGVGGILGPMLSAMMLPAKPVIGDYAMTTLIIGALVGISALMALFTKPPKAHESG